MGAAKKSLFDKDWFKSDAPSKIVKKVSAFERAKVTRSEDLPELMTQQEAAAFLKKHIKTIEDWRKAGILRFIKIRGRYFTTPEYLGDFLESEMKRNG